MARFSDLAIVRWVEDEREDADFVEEVEGENGTALPAPFQEELPRAA